GTAYILNLMYQGARHLRGLRSFPTRRSSDLYGTLLGASPGASVSPEVMLRALEQLFPAIFADESAKTKLKKMFPEDNLDTLIRTPDRYREVRDAVNSTLGIHANLPV